MIFFTLSSYCTAIASTLFAIFVILKNPKGAINRVFFLFASAVAFWAFGIAKEISSANAAEAETWLRLFHVCVCLIPVTYYHFSMHVIQQVHENKKALRIGYGLALAFILLIPTSLFIAGVQRIIQFPYYLKPGPFYHIFMVYFVTFPAMAEWKLFSMLRYLKGNKRLQAKYVLIAGVIGFIGGLTSYLPAYNIAVYPWMNSFVLFYVLIMGTSVLKHRLMDIEVIIKKTIMFAGLFGMVMAVVSGVSVLARGIAEHFFRVPELLSSLLTVGLAVGLYNPTRAKLLDLTDRYLFQKKSIYYKLLKENSKQIAMIHSLDEIARQVTAFLVKQGRIRNAGIFIFADEAKEYRLYYPLGYGGREKRPQVALKESDPVIHYFLETRTALTREEMEKEIQGKTDSDRKDVCRQILETLRKLKAEVLIPSFLGVQNAPEQSVKEQKLRSILVLGAKKSDQDYTEEDLAVFFTIAQESAMAAEKARLFDILLKEREEKVQAQADAKMVTCARSIAHETKNALNAIYSPADFMTLYAPQDIEAFLSLYAPQTKNNPDAQRSMDKILNKMKERGGVLRQKAEEIRIVTKTAEGALTSDCVEFQQFSFKVIWDGAAAEVQARYPEVKLYRDLPLPYPYGNVVLLQRVLTNLFMNAAEASGGKENFEIVTRGEYKEMDQKMGTLFEVKDNGLGIAAPVLGKIFQQGFSTKPKPKPHERDASGYGQGLWVCRQTIEEIHKGKIWVESEMGKGTSFFFWLPLGEGCGRL